MYPAQAVLVDIFSGKDGEFLGRSSILPQHLKDDGGRLTLTISNKELLPVGVLQCELTSQLVLFILIVRMYIRTYIQYVPPVGIL